MFFSRLAVVAATAATVLVASAGLASAHVSVSSPDAGTGGYGKVTFRVPNESDTATTVKIRVQLPTKTPLASVSTMPVPGWTATTTKAPLNPPVKDDDGNTVSEAVSVVEFDAAPGSGIGPGQFQEFSLSVGPFPDAKTLSFAAVQSYSDGTETAWIDPTVEGQPEPDHPAPTLTVGASSSSSSSDGSSSSSADSGSSSGTGTVALILSIVALLLGVAGVVLGLRAGRRTVSS